MELFLPGAEKLVDPDRGLVGDESLNLELTRQNTERIQGFALFRLLVSDNWKTGCCCKKYERCEHKNKHNIT